MPQMPSNAQTLVMRIFDAWKAESYPNLDESVAFEIFASELALRSYGLTLEEIEAGVVGGGQDGAIDSVYVFFDDSLLDVDSEVMAEDSRAADFGQGRSLELWVVQAKRTPSFSESAIDKLESTLRRVLDLSQSLSDLEILYNESLLERFGFFRKTWEKLLNRRVRISVNIVYAAPGDVNGITAQVEAKLIGLRQVIQQAVPAAQSISVDLLGDKELLAKFNERPSYTLSMKYQEGATSGQSHVALVKLTDYMDLIADDSGRLRRHLFEWNVRDHLSGVSVNQEIRKSLSSVESPEFWWMNNGVTIICSDATSAAKTYSLTGIQIVNGLQTSHEIFEVLRENRSSAIGERLLLVRIIVTDDPVTRDLVIRATNRQTAIDDASLRATDEVQRNIESYFLTHGWYYDRRKNFYKNEGRDTAKIVSIQYLGATITALGLARPDKARGKPSSLLKNDDDYRQVFNASIDLQTYLWAARLQRQTDAFILSDLANASVSQKSNLKFHLSMLVVETMNGNPIRRPHELRGLASRGASVTESELTELFHNLKSWSDTYLRQEGVILERATKAQPFTEYLLGRARMGREDKANELFDLDSL